jgi:hypothetical protein
MSTPPKLSIKYFTDPQMRAKEPAKAINVLYDLIEKLDGEINDLRARVEHLEDKWK